MFHSSKNSIALFFISVFIFLTSSGCSTQIIATYDPQIYDEIVNIAYKVDLFLATIQITPKNERQFKKFEKQYIEIEADLNRLLFRNSIRPLNELSTKQTENAIALWKKEIEGHRKKDKVSNLILKRHRKQYQRVFVAMAKGEELKQ